MNISTVTVQEAVIDSTWCGHSRPLQNRTEIADMLRVLNKCRRVKGSAVTRARTRQREGASEIGRGSITRHKPKGTQTETHSQRLKENKKTGRSEGTGSCSFPVSTDLDFDRMGQIENNLCV